MKNILEINTSDNKKVYVELKKYKKSRLISGSTILKSEVTLFLIDKLLKSKSLVIEDLDAIEINLGPGSFTGLRVGAAIANALGYLLKIPINNKKIGELVQPVYNK